MEEFSSNDPAQYLLSFIIDLLDSCSDFDKRSRVLQPNYTAFESGNDVESELPSKMELRYEML